MDDRGSGLPKKRNPQNPPPTTKFTFVQPETNKRNPPHMATVVKITPNLQLRPNQNTSTYYKI